MVSAFLIVLAMMWAGSLVLIYREPLIELPDEMDDPPRVTFPSLNVAHTTWRAHW